MPCSSSSLHSLSRACTTVTGFALYSCRVQTPCGISEANTDPSGLNATFTCSSPSGVSDKSEKKHTICDHLYLRSNFFCCSYDWPCSHLSCSSQLLILSGFSSKLIACRSSCLYLGSLTQLLVNFYWCVWPLAKMFRANWISASSKPTQSISAWISRFPLFCGSPIWSHYQSC